MNKTIDTIHIYIYIYIYIYISSVTTATSYHSEFLSLVLTAPAPNTIMAYELQMQS